MNVGLSSAVFYPQKSEIALQKVAKMQFPVCEYFYNCEYEISDDFLSDAKKVLSENKVNCVSIHPYTAFAEGVFFFSDYLRRTNEQLKKYSEVFKRAKTFGAKYFTFHGNRAIRGLEDYACSFDDKDFYALNELTTSAKKEDLTLCLENVSWCKSANINYLRKVHDSIDDIGFTFDLKQARRAGVDYRKYLEVMSHKLKNIHISDYDENHDCLLPGEGVFDFKTFFCDLERIKYKGDVIIEVYSSNYDEEERILEAKRFVEQFV